MKYSLKFTLSTLLLCLFLMLSHSIRLGANQEITYQHPDNKLIPIRAMDNAMEFCPGHLQIAGDKAPEGQIGIRSKAKLNAGEVHLKDETERLPVYRSPRQKSLSRAAKNYAPKQSTSVGVKKGKISFQIFRDRSF